MSIIGTRPPLISETNLYELHHPTLNMYNLSCDDAPYFSQVNEHIRKAIQENNTIRKSSVFDEDAWTNSNSIFFEYQKEDLLLTDSEENQWVVLSK